MTGAFGLASSRMRAVVLAVAAALCSAALFYFAPLFHVVSLDVARQQSARDVFDARKFVERFWTERLLASVDQAADAAQLLAAVEQDRAGARKTNGRSVGLSDVYYYFITGIGRVVSVEQSAVRLALDGDPHQRELILETGNVFGNAVRDGTGLLDVNDFANSRDFNDISSEINRRIEQQVLPELRAKAVVGAEVRFAGCAEIMDEDADLQPLRVIPFIAEVP